MGVVDRLRWLFADETAETRSLSWPWPSDGGWFTFDGNQYPYGLSFTRPAERQEEIGWGYSSLVHGAYKENGVVFACILARLLLFSEARFQFRRLRSGRPGELFGTEELRVLETPEPGRTTGDLLARAEQDGSLAGNWFARRDGDALRRMRPDWTDIIVGSFTDEDVVGGDLNAEAVGYVYHQGGRNSGRDPLVLDRREVAHFAPIPDPDAAFRGMSWLTPLVREIMADKAATTHKLRSLEEGGIRNSGIKLDTNDKDKFEEWVDKLRAKNDGLANAYKRMYLAQGMDVVPMGLDFQELDLKEIQGAGETRIAAAAGVPPIIVGLSEGLAAATYSNYGQARRRFADGTMRPLWRNMAASLARVVDVPPDAELWYDDRDIPFLQEDVKDAADILQTQANAMRTLVDAGFEAGTVVEAVTAGDLNRLEHTGLFSVQLQPPGTEAPESPVSTNGDVDDEEALRALAKHLEDLRGSEVIA